EEVFQHRLRRRHAERTGRAGDPRLRQEGRARHCAGNVGAGEEGARRQIDAGRNVGRLLLDFLAGRHRRHHVHADHQRAGSRDPRRVARIDEAGMERQGIRAAADPAFVAQLRPSRDRRRRRRAFRHLPRTAPRRHAPGAALSGEIDMANTIELKVPDIGDFHDVPVIEVLVKAGDRIEKDQSLVTLESAKATMEVPSSAAGVIREVKVKVGDNVEQGAVIAVVEAEDSPPSPSGRGAGGEGSINARDSNSPPPSQTRREPEPSPAAAGRAARAFASAPPLPEGEGKSTAPDSRETGRKADMECAMLVLGSGPGGYSAAFRAADLGLDTILVERYGTLGGVCLNVGCIPSKALLHAAEVIDAAALMGVHGIEFGKPKIDLDKLRDFKDKTVGKLTGGLASMAKRRKVRAVQGIGTFVSPHELEIVNGNDKKLIRFEQAIIAAGSQAVHLPMFPWDDERVMDSTGALQLRDVPKNLLVVGGGIIGLEMATVYRALGSNVTVVEFMDQLMPGADTDLVRPLATCLKNQGVSVHLKTKVTAAKAQKNGITCVFEGDSIPEKKLFDRVLVAVGRDPNGGRI